jgi:L-lysine 2,3-aminomutase
MNRGGMITAQPEPRQTKGPTELPSQAIAGWQRELAEAVTRPGELLALLGLSPADLGSESLESLEAACRLFPLRVPRSFISRMQHGNPGDPLLRQVLPAGAESVATVGFESDPLAEAAARIAPGLLHKYAGRALMITTSACAVHCRYCFRREYDYATDVDDAGRWSAAIDGIRADPSIEEVILSGGDPLSLANARLGGLLTTLSSLPQIRRLRLHTRTPIVLPSRVDAGLLQVLAATGKDLVIVVHCNHAREIDAGVAQTLRRLRGVCALLLNQSVLLAGINNSADALAGLSLRLFECGVLPYYLHQLDRVRGAAHFAVSDASAIALISEVNGRLPGYLVPRLVREVAGAVGKLPVAI